MEIAIAAGLLSAILLGTIYAGFLLARDPNRPSLEAITGSLSRLARLNISPERTDDYGWIDSALQACRQEAARQPGSLHFLVVPLAPANKGDVRWATKSTASAGNAELLNFDDTLAGLRKGDLQLYPGEYTFSVTSVPANIIYKWAKTTGVSRFITDEAEQIAKFRMSFQIGDSQSDTTAGSEFSPIKGNCQWAGALITG